MHSFAGIAQLVERNLAKVEVAGSSPVSRSFFLVWYPSGLRGKSAKLLFDSSNLSHTSDTISNYELQIRIKRF